MTARDLILQRLRATSPPLPVPTETPETPPPVASLDESVARFTLEADALGVECHVESTAEGVRERLASLVRGKRVLSWYPQALPYDAARVLEHATYGDAPRDEQAAAEIGVTGCDAAIAETASLVAFSGPGQSRSVSLLPPVHIALVPRDRLCYSMAEVFARHRTRFESAAACTIITGPSRTADIELTLTLGIHGPGHVIVILGP
jgi:L-lactate dehydrogenase complex protein LldG